MTLFGKDVSLSLNDLQTGINRLFDQVWHAGIRTGPFDGQDWAPPVDMTEKNDRYVVQVELPGISLEDVEVTCSNTQLTIKGQKAHSSAKEEDDHAILTERRYGSFCRVIHFAEAVRSEDMAAKLDKGILQVEAPKKTATTSREIKISIKESG